MSELILKGTDLFMGKTGIADPSYKRKYRKNPVSAPGDPACFCRS